MAGARALKEIPMKELRNKRKDDLLQMIVDARADVDEDNTNPKCIDDDNTRPRSAGSSIWDVNASLDQIKAILEPLLKQVTDQLQQEIADLKCQVNDLQSKLVAQQTSNPIESDDDWSVVPPPRQKGQKTFARVVEQSVKAALQEDRCKRDVVISGAPEEGDDMKLIGKLCEKMEFATKPTNAERLGKKEDRARLLKLSFTSSFDARAFMARYSQARQNDPELPRYRLRSGKSKEEWSAFKKHLTLANKLNEDARKNKDDVSYSVRDNGQIWKFAKNDSGAWRRVSDWVPDAGNC